MKIFRDLETLFTWKVDQLLNLQELKSASDGKPAHDELLFITIHQGVVDKCFLKINVVVYELWFKQIIFEVDALREVFATPV